MGTTGSNQPRRLQSAVVRPPSASAATRPPQSSAHPAQKPWTQFLDAMGTKPKRLTDTQRRRIRRQRAKLRDEARQMGALQALDNATRKLVVSNLKALRGRPANPAVPELQWTNISRSGDPSGGAAPSGGGLPVSSNSQRASSCAERFKRFSS